MHLGLAGAALGIVIGPTLMCAARKPMQGLRGLHDSKLFGSVGAGIVLNQCGDCQRDNDEPLGFDSRDSEACQRNLCTLGRRHSSKTRGELGGACRF